MADVNSFRRLWHIRLTIPRLIAAIAAIAIVIAATGVVLMVATPLRALLPGYLSNSSRDDFENMAMRVDSLSAIVDIQNTYLNNFSQIINDDLPEEIIPEEIPVDSVMLIPVDSLLPTSETERKFAKEFEQREKHNLSVLTPIVADGMTFYRPVSASSVEETDQQGVKIVELTTPPSAPVSAIYRGTVIAVLSESGTTLRSVVVQHPRDFVSIYSGLADVYVSPGEKINAGARLGATSSRLPRLSLCLYHNGSALNPAEYISF